MVQTSREGGERSPGCCSREEGGHNGEVVEPHGSTTTPSNDKRLKMFQRLIKTKSHPIRRKSGTAVSISTLWQLRKLLYKAADVVPANISNDDCDCCIRLTCATQPTTTPGNKTLCRIASSGHHDGFPVRNPAGTIPTVT